ncbi:hypothetical protein Daqu01_03388 [Deinococcus aquaticus]
MLLSRRSTPSFWLPYVHSRAAFAQSSERRFQRWLVNKHLQPSLLYGEVITRALREWGQDTLVLALDTSVLFEKFCLIRVSVLFRGRAVPLVSRVIEHSSAQVDTDELLPVLAETKGLLDFVGIRQVRLLADRGFSGSNHIHPKTPVKKKSSSRTKFAESAYCALFWLKLWRMPQK